MVAMLKPIVSAYRKLQAYRWVVNVLAILGAIKVLLDLYGRIGDAVTIANWSTTVPWSAYVAIALIALVVLANWEQFKRYYRSLTDDEPPLADELAKFLKEGQELFARATKQSEPFPTDDANDWAQRLSEFVGSRMGVARAALLTNFSGMTFYSDGSERSKLTNAIEGRLRRIGEFIEAQPQPSVSRQPVEAPIDTKSWRVVGITALVLVLVAAASYATYKMTSRPPQGDGGQQPLEVTGGENPKAEIDALKEQLKQVQGERDVAVVEKNAAFKERDDAKSSAHEREFKLLQAREAAEKSFAAKAQPLLERSALRSSRYAHVYNVNIQVLEELMAVPVRSQNDLDDWILRFEQTKLAIYCLSPLFGQDVNINESPPPNRELKQFRAFNPKHNELLNDIDFHLERLRKLLDLPCREDCRMERG